MTQTHRMTHGERADACLKANRLLREALNLYAGDCDGPIDPDVHALLRITNNLAFDALQLERKLYREYEHPALAA